LANPQGIDRQTPRLSWELASDSRNIRQTGYRILVASSLEKLNAGEGDLWDSKDVGSGESVFVPYAGSALQSRTECFWKVRVTTGKGISGWSEPARWTMGLLSPGEWKASWIGWEKSDPRDVTEGKTRLAARYFRNEFRTEDREIRKATLYICGLGLYEAYINDGRIGEQVLSPTPTNYKKVIKYNTFDVTGQIARGNNTLNVVLGNGRFFSMQVPKHQPEIHNYGKPKLKLQLEITYADGSVQIVTSNTSWKVSADGPIIANSEYDGEEYDARKEFDGAGFGDNRWEQAQEVKMPEGIMEAQLNPNIKVMETLRPAGIRKLPSGVSILDMGQNMVGWLRMKVRGERGRTVTLRFAETLRPDGNIYLDNIRGARVTDKYTLKGGAEETWEPSFTYHGFRYVEITGYPGEPSVDDFEGRVVHDEMETTGQFETSDPTINQIYRNACWGIRGNYRGMPTDCPQRDERMAWLGDRAVGSHGESFIFDNRSLYAKWLDDIEQSQRPNGSVPNTSPLYWNWDYSDNMTWPAAYLIIANMLYEQFGDKQPIVRHYASMKRWVVYMRENYLKDNILIRDTYGDWCMPPESPELIHSKDPARKTDGVILSTTFYYRMLKLLERFARLLDKPDEAVAFAQEAEVIRDAFNEKFFNRETKQYGNNTVTANLLPLCYGMVAEADREGVFRNIVDKTANEFDGHVSTGLVGIQWLMRGLSEYGRADLALKIATNRTYPSWGYMIENGATTIWELWNGNTADPAMNSHNHVMLLGDLIVWFYEYLGGIRNHPDGAGFKQIKMKPYPLEGLDYVTASYHSAHGLIKSAWKKQDGRFQWGITVPCNSTATVYVPTANRKTVTESGADIASAEGVRFIETTGSYAVYEIGSGNYRIESELGTGTSSFSPSLNKQ
jgi:alpha-L-rhamnosidase